MRDIYLHGTLGDEFGKHHRYSVETVVEVIEALRANYPAITKAIRDGFFRVVLGKTKSSGLVLRQEQVPGLRIGNRAVHIVPVVGGRKRGGVGKVIAGVALIGFSMGTFGLGGVMSASLWSGGATIGSTLGNMGLAMTLTGVASLLAPSPKTDDDKKSYTMSGPSSEMREGMIVPIVYGQVITGGYMVNASIIINGPSGSTTVANPTQSAGGTAARPSRAGGSGSDL